MGHIFLRHKNFEINNVKCEYCGSILVENKSTGRTYSCVCIKVDDLAGIRSWDRSNTGESGYTWDFLKKYGVNFTNHGKEQVRKAGGVLWPCEFSDGRMTQELSRSDCRPEYYQVYDTTIRNNGGFVMLSPLASMFFRMGTIFKK